MREVSTKRVVNLVANFVDCCKKKGYSIDEFITACALCLVIMLEKTDSASLVFRFSDKAYEFRMMEDDVS